MLRQRQNPNSHGWICPVSPIKAQLTYFQLQRFGRTGRKQDGIVHVLLAEGREESNISKAQDNHDMIVDLINKGRSLEVYKDVSRLIPDKVKPVCVEKKMEIHEVQPPSPKNPKKAGAKRKRNDDVGRNIPHAAFSGFVPVSKLVAKKKVEPGEGKNWDELGTDDEIDRELEEGPLGFLRRANSGIPSTSTATLKKGKGKAALRKSATEPVKPRARKKKVPDPTSSQGEEDDDDRAIEAGVLASVAASSSISKPQAPRKKDPTPSPPRHSSTTKPVPIDTVLEIADSESEDQLELAPLSPPNKRRKISPLRRISFSSAEDSEADSGVAIVSHTLTKSQRRAVSRTISSPSPPSFRIPSPSVPQSFNADNDMSWLVDDDDEPMPPSPLAPSKPVRMDRVAIGDDSIEISSPRPTALPIPSKGKNTVKRNATPPLELSDSEHFSSPPKKPRIPTSERDTRLMPPPPAPANMLSPPAPSHPIRPLQNKRRIVRVIDDDEEEELEPPPPSQRRLQRLHSTPPRAIKTDKKGKEKEKPQKKAEKRAKPSLLSKDSRLIFEAEAAHSGDEVSEGDSNSDDDVEDEYDREFIKDSPMTQANDSYDQSYAYRKSLLTQMPSTARVPLFANAPVRPRPFGRLDSNKRRHLVSSSPPPPDEEMDTYEMDSFVVGDEEDIIYSDGASEMLEDF